MTAYGATLLPTFDPERVTHIIVQESVKEPGQLLTRLNVKSIDDIPKHVPVLRWEWVDVSWKKRAAQPVHEYPAFKTRITKSSDYAPLSPPPDTDDLPGPSRKASTSRAQPEPVNHSDQEDSNDSGDEHPQYVLFLTISLSAPVDLLHLSAVFRHRINSGNDGHALPGKQRLQHTPQGSRNSNPSDPLAEFYDQARDEIDMEVNTLLPFLFARHRSILV